MQMYNEAEHASPWGSCWYRCGHRKPARCCRVRSESFPLHSLACCLDRTRGCWSEHPL